jgi:hypothetical protein
LLADGTHAAQASSFRRSTDSAGSDFSLWSDTGDIAEQLDEEDPLRELIEKDSDFDNQRANRRVRLRSPSSSDRQLKNFGIEKDHIPIPNPKRKPLSRGNLILVTIMSGGRASSHGQMHGLTGKPLLYFTSIFVSLGVFLFGYDQGVMSGIIT